MEITKVGQVWRGWAQVGHHKVTIKSVTYHDVPNLPNHMHPRVYAFFILLFLREFKNRLVRYARLGKAKRNKRFDLPNLCPTWHTYPLVQA